MELLKEKIVMCLLQQCRNIFQSTEEISRGHDVKKYGLFPHQAVIKLCEGADSEIRSFFKKPVLFSWKIEEGTITQIENDIEAIQKPYSGMYFYEASFWISYDLKKKQAYVLYQFGLRYGSSLKYDIKISKKQEIVLENETVLWMS